MDYNFKPGEVVVTGWNSKRQGTWSLKPEYGVKVVHIPTGIIVTCEEERSQHRNRHLAFMELQIQIRNLMDKPLTNTEKSVLFRKRNAELGRSELRGIWATDDEKASLKEIIKAELDNMRKEDDK